MPDSFTCPVCGGHSAQVRLLVAAENIAALESFIGSARPAGVQVRDYALHRCDACTLGSSVPAIGGDEAFYSWATSFPGYYPEERWDWDAALARLVAVGAKNFIEAGCGLGSFLEKGAAAGIVGHGVDFNTTAVAAAQRRGLHVERKSLSEKYLEGQRSYDAAVAFQVLEHLEDPLKFLRELLSVVRPGGCVLLSTPYSPKHDEVAWTAPFEHPPHHLTMWNERSAMALGRAAGAARTEVLSNPTKTPVKRALSSLWKAKRRLAPASRAKQLALALRHPQDFLHHLACQHQRDTLVGGVAGDIMLAIFHKA